MNLPCDALDADNLERVRNTLKSKSKNVDYKTIPTSDYIENPQIKTSKCFSTLRTIRILTSDSKESKLEIEGGILKRGTEIHRNH